MSVELRGTVVDRGTQAGLAGLRVQAWRETATVPSGEAVTGDRGEFVLVAGTDDQDGQVAFTFRILRDDLLLLDTEGRLVWSPDLSDHPVVIELEPRPEPVSEVRGQLTGRDGRPLPGFVVELRAAGEGDATVPVGAFRSGAAGDFVVRLRAERELSAVVRDADGAVLSEAPVQLRRDQLRVRCDLSIAERPDPPLAEAVEVLGADLPADYLDRLAAAGVTTLGHFGRAADDIVEPEGAPAGVPALRTAAGLRTLTPDLQLIRALTANGYPTLRAVATAPRDQFAERLADRLDPVAAAALQDTARAQRAYLGTLIAAERSAAGRPAETQRRALTGALPGVLPGAEPACACSDCRSAVSPAAYLADLLDYAVAHVTRGGQQLTLDDVVDLTLQPLQSLPLDCDAIDTPVPRLRIVVEVLRAHLAREWAIVPQDRRDALARAERGYCAAAYQRLLAEHGTSFEELRGARIATATDRASLAERLGIDLVAPDPLADLLLDPNATPAQLTEAALQRLFGYQDTTADPLAAVLPGLLADRRRDRQRLAWLAADHPADGYSFERETQSLPALDPDLVGPVDFRDQNPAGNACFQLYAPRRAWVDGRVQQLRQDLAGQGVAAVLAVALGTPAPDFDALAADLLGTPTAAEAARAAIAASGLTPEAFGRLMEIRAMAAAPAPAAPPTSADLDELAAILTQAEKVRGYPTWVQEEANRNVRLDLGRFRLVDVDRVAATDWLGPRSARAAWQEALRRRSARPVVDPVLLGPVDFHDPSPSGPLYQLWDDRRQFVAARVAQYSAGTPSLTLFENRVRTVLDEMPAARWRALVDRYAAGAPLTEELATYTITRPELGRLVRLRSALDSGLPVADPEWLVAAQVLARVVTRRQHARWRSDERAAGIVIGPDDFVLAGLGAVTPPPLLGSIAERSAWQDVLRARIDEDEATRTASAAAIRAAEDEALPLLRDALVAACTVPLDDLAERADWLGDRLLIDVVTGPLDRTTRVAQAIESVQVLLFSLRTAQLTDTHPDLDLVGEHFDEEWDWIGGYATWRSAMFVFLYPENLLLPSLRRHQTYGFRRLVAALRSGRRATPDGALAEVREYLSYLDDVCSLRIAAVAVTGSGRGASAREYTYLFGQSEWTGQVYWSRDDATGAPGRTQSSWAPIKMPAGLEVTRVVGACPSTGFGPDWLYLIVQTFDASGPKLGFVRLAVEQAGSLVLTQDSGWSELQELDLPDGTANFTAVLVQNQYAEWPELAIHTSDGRFFFRRLVDADWEEGDWRPVDLRWTTAQITLPQADLETLLDVVYVNGWGRLVFARYRSGTVWALFVATFQGLRAARVVSTQARIWQGVLSIDDTTQAPNPSYPLARTTRAYAFWSDGSVSWYHSFGVATTGIFSAVQSSNSWLDADGALAVSGGQTSPQGSSGSRPMVGFRRGGSFRGTGWNEPGQYLTTVRRLGVDSVLVEGPRRHVAPRLNAVDVVQIGELQRDPLRRHQLDDWVLPSLRFWWDRDANAIASNRDYLQEAYGFVALQAAQVLQQRREYVAALDWLRVVYDYAEPAGSRAIYPGLVDEQTLGTGFDRAADWLLDTMNPHAVAETRRGSYTRSTLLTIVRCLLEFGDDLYTSDTAEAIARARVLYGTALDLLDADELRQDDGTCEALIGQVDVTVGGPEWVPILRGLAESLLALPGRAEVAATVAAVNDRLHAEGTWQERYDGAHAVVDEALAAVSAPTAPEAVKSQTRWTELAQRALLRAPGVEEMLLRFDRLGFGGNGGQVVTITGYWAPAPHFEFCVVRNPIPHTLRLWAELNLFKIRTSRNIAGLEREVEAYSAPTDSTSGLPTIGAGGQLSVPGARTFRPTPYRYPQLVARARELAELARQVESSMFAAIQAGDQERYTRLKARQDLGITRAGVRLQTLRATEATGGVRLAELFKQRASISLDHYSDLLEEGTSSTEQAALTTLGIAAGFHTAAAVASAVAAGIQGSYAAGLSAATLTAGLAPPVWASMSSSIASSASSVAAGLQTVSSLLSMQAGFERRLQEWDFQRSLAAQDLAIADQQIQVAQDRVRVVAQERQIAQLTADNAEQTIDFLDNKFTNVELYDFMAGELERVYSAVLEQAAATAQLASDQLAFERQEDPPAFIRADYWQPSTEGGALAPEEDGSGPDRRGLTGSARLLGDIAQLDGYAFDTERRKLHLTTTLSLAQLAPVEFARFRQTGELTFETPGDWFDRQFPGHYLRLIRRVRLSVIALIPPTTGIRATLAQSGPSYVVIGGPAFSRVRVRGGGFGEVALSSPFSDAGVFELDPQPQLRFPFEGSGLDCRWTFRLPRAANPFDFATIGDVLMTVEYTALSDANLRSQVIASLRPTTEVTLPLSLRGRYPDQWYQLHNRVGRTPPFEVTLEVSSRLLPPHLRSIQLSHVALLLAHDAGTLPEAISVAMLGRPSATGVTGTGAVVPVSGLASSRSNAQGWNTLPRNPVGTWVLQFKDEAATRDLFDSGQLNDVVLALSLSGRPHTW